MLRVLSFWIVRPGLTLSVGLAIAASCTDGFMRSGKGHLQTPPAPFIGATGST